MSERPTSAPSDAFTELVVDHVTKDQVLHDAALLVWALGHDPVPVGDLIHTWVLDRNPNKNDPGLYSELAVLALGLVDWPHVARTVLAAGSGLDAAPSASITSSNTPTSGNVSTHS